MAKSTNISKLRAQWRQLYCDTIDINQLCIADFARADCEYLAAGKHHRSLARWQGGELDGWLDSVKRPITLIQCFRAVVQSAQSLADIAAACRQVCDTFGGYTNILPDSLGDAMLAEAIRQVEDETPDDTLPDWVTECNTIAHMCDIDTDWAEQVGETPTYDTDRATSEELGHSLYQDSAMWMVERPLECDMSDIVAPEQFEIIVGVLITPTCVAPIYVGIIHTPVARKPMRARSSCIGLWRSRKRAWG